MNSLTDFLRLCLNCETEKDLKSLFTVFFTHEEREDLGKRTTVIKELLKDERTQRQISSEFDISISCITRGSNQLKATPKSVVNDLKEYFLESEND